MEFLPPMCVAALFIPMHRADSPPHSSPGLGASGTCSLGGVKAWLAWRFGAQCRSLAHQRPATRKVPAEMVLEQEREQEAQRCSHAAEAADS
jgi:hypothetical protein